MVGNLDKMSCSPDINIRLLNELHIPIFAATTDGARMSYSFPLSDQRHRYDGQVHYSLL